MVDCISLGREPRCLRSHHSPVPSPRAGECESDKVDERAERVNSKPCPMLSVARIDGQFLKTTGSTMANHCRAPKETSLITPAETSTSSVGGVVKKKPLTAPAVTV